MRYLPARALALIGLMSGFASLAVAQPPKINLPAKKEADPGLVEIKLADGSAVRMTLIPSHIEVNTKYGKLNVPVNDIKRIEFGFRFPEGIEAKITDAVSRLGASNYKVREAAGAELLGYRELSYPALKHALKSTDAEVSKRAEELMKKLEDKVPAERLKIQENDHIHTYEFTIAGKIDSATLKARTPYFGEVQIALAEARMLRSLNAGTEVDFNFDGKYASNTEWMETEVEISSDDPIEIRASGTMLMQRGGPGFEAGPNGNDNYRNGVYGPGQLLGRIGKNGKQFNVGEKYKGTPGESGRLYLRAFPGPWAQ